MALTQKTETIKYENGELQRLQLVRAESFDEINFFSPPFSAVAFERVCRLYEEFIVPRRPGVFGQLVLFRLPEGEEGRRAPQIFRKGLKIINGRPLFLSREAGRLFGRLEEKGEVRIVRGSLPMTTVLPVGRSFGFLSEGEQDAAMKCNSSFFVMDRFDCFTTYDSIGTPIGLMVKEGETLNPPLFNREAFFVKKDGSVSVRLPEPGETSFEVDGRLFTPGVNAELFARPAFRKTPAGKGTELIIAGSLIADVKKAGGNPVPSSGFALRIREKVNCAPGEKIIIRGFEEYKFAVQAGNSAVIEGKKTEGFISSFYNIHNLWSTSYPPSLYPLDYEKDRAPRMLLGADAQGRPMLAWLEGKGKFGYDFGRESCGASLKEAADIAKELGMHNAVNLDGGGSAKILLKNKRSLLISDRIKETNLEAERAVPAGLIIN